MRHAVLTKLGAGCLLLLPLWVRALDNERSNRFDGAFSIALNTVIQQGRIYTQSTNVPQIKSEVKNHLYYLVGQLLDTASPALEHGCDIEIRSSHVTYRNIREVSYNAKFLIAWHTETNTFPATYKAIVPAWGSQSKLSAFSSKYWRDCGGNQNYLWSEFRPNNPNCPWNKGADNIETFAPVLEFSKSPLNAQNKSPEYSRVWEDNTLEVVFVAGNENSRFEPSEDTERNPRNPVDKLLDNLQQAYGNPVSSKKTSYSSYELLNSEFKTGSGRLVVHAFYLTSGNIQQVSTTFKSQFQTYASQADVIAYNGHASHGENIAAFTHLAKFKPQHYYLYWINACHPFTYLDDYLFTAIVQQNPTAKPSQHLDVMTVAGIGNFDDGADVTEIIYTLVEKKATFRTLLNKLEAYNVVLGD